MDNAPIHRKTVIAGHRILFLSKYSPDSNDIAHNFSVLERARTYTPPEMSLDQIICNYCAA